MMQPEVSPYPDPATAEHLRRMYDDGASIGDLARDLHMSRNTVRAVIDNHRCPPKLGNVLPSGLLRCDATTRRVNESTADFIIRHNLTTAQQFPIQWGQHD
jgi:hypothetical protein